MFPTNLSTAYAKLAAGFTPSAGITYHEDWATKIGVPWQKVALVADVNNGEITIRNSDMMYKLNVAAGQVPTLWHNKGDNVLFGDFHVETVQKDGRSRYLVLQ